MARPEEDPPTPRLATLDRSETTVDSPCEEEAASRANHYLAHPRADAFGRNRRDRSLILIGLAHTDTEAAHKAALKMRECLAWPSVWIDEDGGLHSVMSRCKHRLCPYCARYRQATVAKRVEETVIPWDSIRHIVLTLQHSDDPLAEQLDHLLASYRRLRQTKLWKGRVHAAIATVEITRNARTDCWHPHLHILATGDYVPHGHLRECWRTATGGSTIVHLSRIDSRTAAAAYVSKYVAKPAELATFPPEALAEYVAATAGRRLLLATGQAHNARLTRLPESDAPKLRRQVASWHEIQRAYQARRPYAIALVTRVADAWPMLVRHVRYADDGVPEPAAVGHDFDDWSLLRLVEACADFAVTGKDPALLVPQTPPRHPPPLLWGEEDPVTSAAIRA